MRGRRPKFLDVDHKAVLKGIREGRPTKSACAEVGMSRRTFQRWLSQDKGRRSTLLHALGHAMAPKDSA